MQQSLAMHVSELKQLNESLKSRGEILEKSSEQSIENDRMRSKFLHYISNQMISPGDLIDKSVTKLCNNYHNANMKEIEQEIKVIKQQSTEVLKLLGHIIEAVQMESGKEGSHE
jgi:K+-sensing histidine kinase KdpD